MRARFVSGRYFVRFVVIEDQTQRRSICAALNQWMVSAAEKATGIGSHFATSLELTPATEYVPSRGDVARAPSPASGGDANANVGRTLLPATADTITVRPRSNGPASKLRSRHQHSLSFPLPLRFLTEGSVVEEAALRDREVSREAAQECSPRRKPWVGEGKKEPAPKGRKSRSLKDPSTTPIPRPPAGRLNRRNTHRI